MTRRIVIAILLACWTVVIAGGVVAYLVTRSVLLDDLDAQIYARATTVPEVGGESAGDAGRHPDDRYLIQNSLRQTVGRRSAETQPTSLTIVERRFATLADGRRVRSLTLKGQAARGSSAATSQPVTIVYSGSSERFDRIMSRLGWALSLTGALAGLAAAVAAVIAARAALRPLSATAETIARINEASLDRRLDAAALPVELAPVAKRLNEMLARLESASIQRRRFLADAAHELRTPVAAMMMTIEVTLRRPRDATALTTSLERCLDDVKRLKTLVEGLLRQVRSESAPSNEPKTTGDIIPMLARCADVAARLGAGRRVAVACRLPESLVACLAMGRLETIVNNLLANAVEYNRDGGRVELSCEPTADGLTVVVADDGPGIAPDLLPVVFEPFVRGQSRNQDDGEHLGLGLALVKAHVTAMAGRFEFTSNAVDGTTFRIMLPSAPTSQKSADIREPEGAAR